MTKTEAQETYSALLKDPRWQKKRLEIFQRDEFTCQICYDTESTLNVHHRRYLPGKKPWEYDDQDLVTLCEGCHENERQCWPEYLSALESELQAAGCFSDSILDLAHLVWGLKDAKVPTSKAIMIFECFATIPKLRDGIIEQYLERVRIAEEKLVNS